MQNKINLNSEDASKIADVLAKVHGDYIIKLNNEVANLLSRAKLNNKSRGLLGPTGHDYYSSNQLEFKNLQELAKLRRDIKESFLAYRIAFEEDGGKIHWGMHDDEYDEKIQKMLDELSELIRIRFNFKI